MKPITVAWIQQWRGRHCVRGGGTVSVTAAAAAEDVGVQCENR